ncbi:MAG: uroporphyrinogen decarboxylase family protein [Thermoleophilia bacterium]
MNSRERVLAVLDGRPVDTVPVVPVVDGYYAPQAIGKANDECWLDGACMADALAAAFASFGYDGVVAEMGLGADPNVLGCKVEVEGHEVPLVVDTLVEERDDIRRIVMPDPWADGKLEPVKRLVAGVGGSAAVLGSVRSPFEYAATVRGLFDFMTDFYRDPGFVMELIEAVTPATVVVGRALAAAGADAIVVKDSFASSSMISPEHYREFAFDAEVAAIEQLKEFAPVILHVCRNSMPIIAEMARTGAAALEIDSPVDLAAARRAVGGEIVLKGNIDAAEVVEKGTPEDVDAAVREAMAAVKEEGRFILSTGDSIPVSAPAENIKALVDAGRKYGKY